MDINKKMCEKKPFFFEDPYTRAAQIIKNKWHNVNTFTFLFIDICLLISAAFDYCSIYESHLSNFWRAYHIFFAKQVGLMIFIDVIRLYA